MAWQWFLGRDLKKNLIRKIEETTRATAYQPMNENNATNFTNEHELVKLV
jgi:hypothetical protein